MNDVPKLETSPSGPWSWAARGLLTALAAGAGGTIVALAPAPRVGSAMPPVLVLDANAASPRVLSALPGVGPAMAGEIAARRSEAPFLDWDDLARRARGIGPMARARLVRYLRVGPPGR